MAWFRRSWFRGAKGTAGDSGQPSPTDDFAHLEAFARSRRGVEGFLEPKTTVTETTLLMVAHDGEWTRRRMPSPGVARQFGNRLGVPVYDVGLVGYPRRMREFNERRKREASGSSDER